jgi:hypothetical protein
MKKEKKEECPDCEGRGYTIWSCCGDDITNNINEIDLCPTCLEHCGDEQEQCETCVGTGIYKAEAKTEAKANKKNSTLKKKIANSPQTTVDRKKLKMQRT